MWLTLAWAWRFPVACATTVLFGWLWWNASGDLRVCKAALDAKPEIKQSQAAVTSMKGKLALDIRRPTPVPGEPERCDSCCPEISLRLEGEGLVDVSQDQATPEPEKPPVLPDRLAVGIGAGYFGVPLAGVTMRHERVNVIGGYGLDGSYGGFASYELMRFQ